MFQKKKILILDDLFAPMKYIKADVQGYAASIEFEFQISLGITTRLFCKPDEVLNAPVYFRIGKELYKPFVYKKWDSYYELYLYHMRRDNVAETIDELIDFFLYERGGEIVINEVTTAAVVIEAEAQVGPYDDKIVIVKDELKRGDLITYEEKPRLIYYPVDHRTKSFAGRARECNQRIAFNYAGDVQWFDVIMESQTYDIDTGKVITLPEGQVEMWLQENEESTRVSLNQRYLNTGRAYKVTGIDRAIPGLMRLFCELTESNVNDNFELEIADYYAYFHVYTIAIDNPQPIGITAGNTVQLSVTVKDNGSVVTDQAITYTSSDTAIATIDGTGLITGIAAGSVAITAALTNAPDVTSSAALVVAEAPPAPTSYTIQLSATNHSLKLGGSAKTVTAVVYSGSTAVSDKTVTWSIRNGDGSTATKVSITSSTGTTCKVQAVDNEDYDGAVVYVKATLSDDDTVYSEWEFDLELLY